MGNYIQHEITGWLFKINHVSKRAPWLIYSISHNAPTIVLCFALLWLYHKFFWVYAMHVMMTSSNGNIFRVIGLCGESTDRIPWQRAVTRCFDLRLNKRLSKQSKHKWFERYCAHFDVTVIYPYPLGTRTPLPPSYLMIHEYCFQSFLGITRTVALPALGQSLQM